MSARPAPPVSRAVRVTTVAAVVVVALVAATVSFAHMQTVAERAGEAWRSWLIPASVDGLIVAASMVLLVRRRAGLPGGWLAWVALLGGVVASLSCNVAAAEPTVTARLIAAWPPLAFAAAFELLLQQRRSTAPGGSARVVDDPATDYSPVSNDLGLPASNHGVAPAAPQFRPAMSAPSVGPPAALVAPFAQVGDHLAHPSASRRPLVDREPTGAPVRTADGSASGSADDPLVDRVAALVAASPPDRPPGRRTVARELAVTEYRAGQLLAHIATITAPAGDPGHNGSARKERDR